MTLPGIPCLYYGTEFALQDGEAQVGWDCESGRMMFYRHKGGPAAKDVRKSVSYAEISKLASLREKLPVLRTGSLIPLWVDSGDSEEDDGVFAFARASADGADFAVVVVNASDKPRITCAGDHVLQLPSTLQTTGRVLRPVLTIGAGPDPEVPPVMLSGPLWLPIPASSLVIYQAVPAAR